MAYASSAYVTICQKPGDVPVQVSAEWQMKPNPDIAPPDTYIGMAGVSEVRLMDQPLIHPLSGHIVGLPASAAEEVLKGAAMLC